MTYWAQIFRRQVFAYPLAAMLVTNTSAFGGGGQDDAPPPSPSTNVINILLKIGELLDVFPETPVGPSEKGIDVATQLTNKNNSATISITTGITSGATTLNQMENITNQNLSQFPTSPR